MKNKERIIILLDIALQEASDAGILDELAASVHPDTINQFCDAVDELAANISHEHIDRF